MPNDSSAKVTEGLLAMPSYGPKWKGSLLTSPATGNMVNSYFAGYSVLTFGYGGVFPIGANETERLRLDFWSNLDKVGLDLDLVDNPKPHLADSAGVHCSTNKRMRPNLDDKWWKK